jgi:5-methylcytosine-specific restriction enzyme B
VRDEVALFVLQAREIASAFVTAEGGSVDPLDLAIHMKVLPRIIGGSSAIRRVVGQLCGWAVNGKSFEDDSDVVTAVDRWAADGRPSAYPEARFPRSAARLSLMYERLQTEGYTSFWL